MEVWIVTYDMGMYGSGISGVFSSEEKAEAYVKRERRIMTYTTFTVESSYIVDEKDV